jgi:C-terminal peptidase prc
MFRRCLLLSACVLACIAPRAGSAEPATDKAADASFCRLLWAATDVVLDRHVEPPARQQMLLAGVKELLAKGHKPAVPDLGRRVSGVTTVEQFTALVAELIPGKIDQQVAAAAVEAAVVTGHGHFFDEQSAKAAKTIEANNYVGVGIQIRTSNDKDHLAEIMMAFAGGPYRRAGGRAGDLIVEVDGAPMTGRSLADVVKALRGEEGTPVTTLVRQPGAETRLLKMVREVIPFQSVIGFKRVSEESFDFRPDSSQPIAYVRLEMLTSSTYHELRRLERQLKTEGCAALILDLRGTPPGSIVHAAQVADAFLDGGVMWTVRDARGRTIEYKADRDCLFRDWPMVVLTNELTVDTAAVIAAGLQDRGRATLVGVSSPAPVTVRSLEPLPDDTGGINMPTGTLQRIKHADRPGLQPDKVVTMEPKQWEALSRWHSSQVSPDAPATKPPDDPQLAKALELLGKSFHDKKSAADHRPGAAGG